MGNGFQFIDIILFAMIAAFLILRLRNVLGRRGGHEGNYRDPFKADSDEAQDDKDGDNIVQMSNRENDETETPEITGDAVVAEPVDDSATDDSLAHDSQANDPLNDPLAAGMAQVHRADPTFDTEDFLVGARVAFEMVLVAYASGDRETLGNLLSPGVLDNLLRAIDDRESAGHVVEDTLVGIRSADIVEAYMEGSASNITVKFISEQVNVIRDDKGHVLDGSPNQVADVVDFWTFARDARSADPNWSLVATGSLD